MKIKVGDKVHVRPEKQKKTDIGVITKVGKTDRFGSTDFYFELKNGDEWMSGTDQIRKLNGKAVNESQLKNLIESGAGVRDILEAEIDWVKEKSWRIKEKRPIKVFPEQEHRRHIRIVVKPKTMLYDTFQSLDTYGIKGGISTSSYDYKTGEAVFLADNMDDVKAWVKKFKKIIKL